MVLPDLTGFPTCPAVLQDTARYRIHLKHETITFTTFPSHSSINSESTLQFYNPEENSSGLEVLLPLSLVTLLRQSLLLSLPAAT